MSKINQLLYGSLSQIHDWLEQEEATEQEVRCAIQNLCRFLEAQERRIKRLEDAKARGMRMINGHPNGDPMNDPPSLR